MGGGCYCAECNGKSCKNNTKRKYVCELVSFTIISNILYTYIKKYTREVYMRHPHTIHACDQIQSTIYKQNLYGNVNFAFPIGQVDTEANATDCDTITIIGVKYVAYFGPCGIRMICDGSLNVFAASLVG